jgi:hypothetical protein
MSRPEKPVIESCVPVSTSGALRPKPLPDRLLELQERSVQLQSADETGRPDTRSPEDPWHSEGYLIKCLVRMHGWAHLEAGVLRRFKRG